MSDTENILQAFGKFFGDFIKGMIIKLTAAAIAAFALAIALQVLGIGGDKVFSGLKAAAGLKDVFKAGFKSFAGVGMASGGTVPPGYPNDTFPARLTSGEEVIPARGISRQPIEVVVSGKFVMEGREAVLLVERGQEFKDAVT